MFCWMKCHVQAKRATSPSASTAVDMTAGTWRMLVSYVKVSAKWGNCWSQAGLKEVLKSCLGYLILIHLDYLTVDVSH